MSNITVTNQPPKWHYQASVENGNCNSLIFRHRPVTYGSFLLPKTCETKSWWFPCSGLCFGQILEKNPHLAVNYSCKASNFAVLFNLADLA